MPYFDSRPSSDFFFLVLLFTSAVALSIYLSDSSSEAALSFLQVAASTVYLICRAVLAGTAYFLVFVINGLRVPGEALQAGLQRLAEAIRSLASYLGEIAVDAVSSLVSAVLELVKEAVEKSIELAAEGATSLAKKGAEGIQGLSKFVAEVVRFMVEVVAGAVAELWNAYKEALKQALEKWK